MSVADILTNLNSPDNSVRLPAQQTVENAQQSDFPGFCMALIDELKNPNNITAVRQQAGLVLKNSVAPDIKDVDRRAALDTRWKSLTDDVRGRIKASAVSVLGCPEKEVRKIACLMIANFARIEIPFGLWPDLIPTLVTASTSGVPEQMEAALTCLGQVCEEANNHTDVATAMEKDAEAVLKAIFAGLTAQQPDVVWSAMHALNNSMDFITTHMKQESVRNFLIKTVAATIRDSPVVDIRAEGMSVLVKVADGFYELLPQYIEELYELTRSSIVNNDKDTVVLSALMFWISICENEIEANEDDTPHANYIGTIQDPLLDLCFGCMTQQEDGQREDDWNVSSAGGKLLQKIADCRGDNAKNKVMAFVFQNVESQNWRMREAAIMALGCLMTGVNKKEFRDTVAQCAPSMINYLKDPNQTVADTTGWVLSIVCDEYRHIFTMDPAQTAKLVSAIGPMINGGDNMMSIRATSILHNLASACSDEVEEEGRKNDTNILSHHFDQLIAVLLQRIDNIDSDQDGRERLNAVEAINAMIACSADDCLRSVNDIVPEVLNRLEGLSALYRQSPNDDILVLQGLLCGSISDICKRLTSNVLPHFSRIYNTLGNVFTQQSETILDEAVLCLGAIVHAIGTNFGADRLNEVLPIVLQCAGKFDEESLCEAAIGTLGDFISTLGMDFGNYLPPVMNAIFNTLVNENVDRDLKMMFYSTAGECALHTGEHFAPYLTRLMEICRGAFEESRTITINEETDYGTYDFITSLWAVLCETMSQVCQGSREINGGAALAGYYEFMANVANHVARNGRPEPETFEAAITLIGDIANSSAGNFDVRREAGRVLLSSHISECVSVATNHESANIRETAKWVIGQVESLQA